MGIKHVYLTTGSHFLTDGTERSLLAHYDHACFWRGYMALTGFYGPRAGVWNIAPGDGTAETECVETGLTLNEGSLSDLIKASAEANEAELARYVPAPDAVDAL